MTTMAASAVPSNRRILGIAALAAKAALLLLLLSALVWPDLSGIKGRASTARLIVYPIGAMVLPLWWFLTAGVLTAFAPRWLSRGLTTMVALGFGATAAIVWELGEYVAFIRHSSELQTAYTDTLGDLTLDTLGALLAGLAVFQVRRSIARPEPDNYREATPALPYRRTPDLTPKRRRTTPRCDPPPR